MEFIAKLKSEIKRELRSELRSELLAELKAELRKPELRKPEPMVPEPPCAKKKAAKFEDSAATFSKPSDWDILEDDDASYEKFEAWYEVYGDQYNHMRHAFNSLIKNERYIKIHPDGTVRTYLQTWRP